MICIYICDCARAPACVCIECVLSCPQGAAAYPENEDQQQRLREAAEGLRVATNAAAQNAIKKKLVNRLEVSHSKHIFVLYDLTQTLILASKDVK